MASQPVTARLEALRVTQSDFRPHTSNDNRFSEASCKTLKYWPDFPHRFPTLVGARRFLRRCFAWYNTAHRQRGLGWMTSATVHHGEGAAVPDRRAQVLAAAYARHPERFAAGPPQPIVGQEMAIGFLLHALGRFAAEHHPEPAWVRLEFIEDLLDLPALVIRRRQLVGRRRRGARV